MADLRSAATSTPDRLDTAAEIPATAIVSAGIAPARVPTRVHCAVRIAGISMLAGIFYLACFSALTWPLITRFSTHFFLDDGDGMVFVWNTWWVSKSLHEPRLSPWFTPYLHHPFGISLAGHTLSPFNAFLGAALSTWLSMTQAINALVVFTFVMGGVTAFWLCYSVSRSYPGSLAGGYVFTFSSYHFAHAQGHLNLTSIQWIPLYLLAWISLLRRPGYWRAVGAASALFLVTLCDLYYLMFCLMASGVIAWWQWRPYGRRIRTSVRSYAAALTVMFTLVLATSGTLAGWTLTAAVKEPFAGPGHNPAEHSADVLALFLPGEFSRWAPITQSRWERLRLPGAESSIYLGATPLLLSILVIVGRNRIRRLGGWSACLLVFGILCLGPLLQIDGVEYKLPILPCLALAAMYRFRSILGVPRAGPILAALAAYLLFAAWPVLTPRLATEFAVLALLGALIPAFIYMSRVTPADRYSAAMLALLCVSALLADPSLSQRSLIWAAAATGFCCLAVIWRRGLLERRAIWGWAAAGGFFLLVALANVTPKASLSLGALPYGVLEMVFPIVKLGGTPVRFAVLCTLMTGVLSACAVGRLRRRGRFSRAAAFLVFPLLAVDLAPRGIPSTSLSVPGYVRTLAGRPDSGAVLDTANPPGRQLYYQTLYEKPLAFGYTSRVPRSLSRRERELKRMVTDRQYYRLSAAYGIRYLIARADEPVDSVGGRIRPLDRDDFAALYELNPESVVPAHAADR